MLVNEAYEFLMLSMPVVSRMTFVACWRNSGRAKGARGQATEDRRVTFLAPLDAPDRLWSQGKPLRAAKPPSLVVL